MGLILNGRGCRDLDVPVLDLGLEILLRGWILLRGASLVHVCGPQLFLVSHHGELNRWSARGTCILCLAQHI